MRSLRRLIGICALTAGTVLPSFAQEHESLKTKSPGTALTLSALATVVPMGVAFSGAAGEGVLPAGLALGGLILGPSFGYLYAGETGHALKGIGLRAVVLGATIGATTAICTAGECNIFGDDDGSLAAALIVALAGFVTTSVLAIRDIGRVDDRVRARNERIARSALSVRVTYLPETRAPAILVTLRR